MSSFEFDDIYDIKETAEYIVRRRYTRVCLQFPDGLLKDARDVVVALEAACKRRCTTKQSDEGQRRQDQREGRESGEEEKGEVRNGGMRQNGDHSNGGNETRMGIQGVQLYVMADTTFGHCCVDEVAASHVGAQCVIHYGHACVSKTSRVPVRYVFGKGRIVVEDAAEKLTQIQTDLKKLLLVLYAPEYGYAMEALTKELDARSSPSAGRPSSETVVGVLVGREMEPVEASERCSSDGVIKIDRSEQVGVQREVEDCEERQDEQQGKILHGKEGELGGLKWTLPEGRSIEDYVLIWIGHEGPALTNWMLTYNTCQFARYDPESRVLVQDAQESSRTLKRRYYLVERAKDANIVGIVVGTLGAAGYLSAITRLRAIIASAGKKSYVFVMGKPTPAKLANFPECELFVLVACPQTALLDSKEYYAPVITPYEAELAFVRGRAWTGEYRMGFDSLVEENGRDGRAVRFGRVTSGATEGMDGPEGRSNVEEEEFAASDEEEEPRFSLITGSYGTSSLPLKLNDSARHRSKDDSRDSLELVARTDATLAISGDRSSALIKVDATKVPVNSAAEYLAVRRTYKGLELRSSGSGASAIDGDDGQSALVMKAVRGRTGRAASYEDESGMAI